SPPSASSVPPEYPTSPQPKRVPPGRAFFQRASDWLAGGGIDSTGLPRKMTFEGAPVGEPPSGSSETAKVALPIAAGSSKARSLDWVKSPVPTRPSERGPGSLLDMSHNS